MRRLWDGLDPGTFTSTTQPAEDENQSASVRDADRDAVPPRSSDEAKASGKKASGKSASSDSVSSDGVSRTESASTLLGLPEEANAGEVILVNKRDIMVLQFVVVRLVEKGILDAEEVMRMKKEANKEIRESHPGIANKSDT